MNNVNINAAPVSSPAQSKTPWATRINHWFENHWLFAFNTGWGVFTLLPWLAPIFMALGLIWPARAIYFFYNFFCHQLPERSWFLFGPQISYTQQQIAAAWGVTVADISNELVRRQFIGTPEIGWKVAWSDRMVAMYTSIFIFGLIYALLRQQGIRIKGISWLLLLVLILPMALDGTTHLINDVLRLDFRDTNQWAVVLTNGVFSPTFYAGDMFGSLNSVLRVTTGILFGFGIVWFLWPIMGQEFSPRS
ncbi:MAG: DUF2085 domain-containing protein [Gammaproteobacteria bacterium]|nr:DUF2085 domain-containing protein [Gammaproteobacteria bacterium]